MNEKKVPKKVPGTFSTFSGKKALVIGGTGGIGRAIALGLAEKGAELMIHGGSSRERLDDTLELIKKAGGKAEGFLYSIEDLSAAEEILSRSFKPDILVCAWGPFKRGNLETLDRAFWQGMVEKNLTFPGILVSLVIHDMIEQRYGRILLFGGTNTDTIRGFMTTAAYSAAKTGLSVLAKSVAKSTGPYGVSCNVICPGLTNTEYSDEEQQLYNSEKSPGGIPLDPNDIAKTALYVLENDAINGAIITVDRGLII